MNESFLCVILGPDKYNVNTNKYGNALTRLTQYQLNCAFQCYQICLLILSSEEMVKELRCKNRDRLTEDRQ